MGIYLNPGNYDFSMIIKTEFVDKTGLIDIVNSRINTKENLICISRPRRFGKSYAAQMLCAYYDHTCKSDILFKNYIISSTDKYEKNLNAYNVIYLDITGFISDLLGDGKTLENITQYIKRAIVSEINTILPDERKTDSISRALINLVEHSGRKIVFIIDEWDAIIREAKDDEKTQRAYLNLLRGIFKNGNLTAKVVAAAYITGILPIKKDGSESAISDFEEFTILNPGEFIDFSGFTQNEVIELCKKHAINYCEIKKWYDGYSFDDNKSIFNPYSVISAIKSGRFESYWQKTTASESLFTFINMNYEGLQDMVARLITGESVEVDVTGFKNDFENFSSKDDVLTLLIHLGYLSYDSENRIAKIPNEEIRSEFISLIKSRSNSKLSDLVKKSDRLFRSTIEKDSDEVARAIDEIRKSEYAPTFYNNEQALRYVIKFAYLVCVDKYLKIEELPSGKGIADVVFLPKKTTSDPALIVELKWNKSSDAAIDQILSGDYPEVLRNFEGEILLVGISYDEKTKKHSCKIIEESS